MVLKLVYLLTSLSYSIVMCQISYLTVLANTTYHLLIFPLANTKELWLRWLNVVLLVFPTCYSLLHIFALILHLKQPFWIRKRQTQGSQSCVTLSKEEVLRLVLNVSLATAANLIACKWLNLTPLLFSLWCQLLQSFLEWSLQENMPTRKTDASNYFPLMLLTQAGILSTLVPGLCCACQC